MTRVKICGVTQLDDAARASAAGADFVGLNFWEKSRRRVALDRAAGLAAAVRGAGAAKVVGVFVDADLAAVATVLAAVDLDILQLHGDEPPELVTAIGAAAQRPIWKAVPVGAQAALDALERWPADAILLDTPTPGRGGSGVAFDWSLAREARRRYPARSFLLAGGLTPSNVAAAIADVQPWAVDVASGVEAAPGIKDAAKLAAFIAAARIPAPPG
jgi:phosphoribosylanthranilate isomerase